MKEAYASFYLEGRDDRLLKSDIDVDDIAEQVIAGKGSIHELLVKAATAAAEPLRVDRKKRQWLEDFEDEIKEAGGDAEEAYGTYLSGRIDQLVSQLDDDVVAAMSLELGGEEDDEDEEDDDEEDEGDDAGGES